MPNRLARRVALIGWDAADWKQIHPLLDRGLLPNLQSLIERGVMGNLATMAPPLSSALWTSLATGHSVVRHDVASLIEMDPVLGTPRPVASTTRKTKALWNILSQSGLRSLVVNWFASQPAEPVRGAVVSNAFVTLPAAPGLEWPVPDASVHPASLAEELAELRVSPEDLTGDDLRPFLPMLPKIDQEQDRRPMQLAAILARNITAHSAATWLMEHEQWDFVAVYYGAISDAARTFLAYHPPQHESITDSDFDLYREVMNGVYCFQDMMLGRLRQLAGDDTVFLLVSPASSEGTETFLDWSGRRGPIVISGPSIRRDELVFGAGVLDITPTVLALFGLPAGQDMRGRVLAEALECPVETTRIPSWEDVPGDCGAIPAADVEDSEEKALVDQLIALGYVEPRNEEVQQQLQAARRQRQFVLARAHLSAGRFEEAIPFLEELTRGEDQPGIFALYLAQAYYEAGRREDCRAVLRPLLGPCTDQPLAKVLRGTLALADGDQELGLKYLLEAEGTSHAPIPEVSLLIGRVYLSMQRWTDAERLFRSVLELDDCAPAHAGLAQALLGQGVAEAAAESAMDAIGLRFEDAESHYALGVALARLCRVEEATRAFQTCLKLRPGMSEAAAALGALGRPAACA